MSRWIHHGDAPNLMGMPYTRGSPVSRISQLRIILSVAVVALAILPLSATAQATSGWTKFGDIVFGVNRPQLDAEVRQQEAENAWIQAETAEAETNLALAQQQARVRALVQDRRKWLARVWVDMGCSPAEAVARAYAWSPSL